MQKRKVVIQGVRPLEMVLNEIAKERRKNNIVVRRNIVKERKSTNQELRRFEDRVIIEAVAPHKREPSVYGYKHSQAVHGQEAIRKALKGERPTGPSRTY